jgi:hypothetical protein
LHAVCEDFCFISETTLRSRLCPELLSGDVAAHHFTPEGSTANAEEGGSAPEVTSGTLTSAENGFTLTEPTLFIKARERGQGEWCGTTGNHSWEILKLDDALLATGEGTLEGQF